jgi:membrane-associated phospholipid phosphatase
MGSRHSLFVPQGLKSQETNLSSGHLSGASDQRSISDLRALSSVFAGNDGRKQLLVAIAAWVLAALALAVTQIPLDVMGFLPFVLIGVVTLLVGTIKAQRMPLLAAIARQLGAIVVVTVGCCIAMHAALTLGTPYADPIFHRADVLMAVDPVRISEAVGARPLVRDILDFVYAYTMLVSLASIMLLTVATPRRGIEATGVVTTCLVVATGISLLLPAEGFMATLGSTVPGLSESSGTFFLGVQRAYHENRVAMLTPAFMSGVISFPSYHVIMGMIALQVAFHLRVPLLGAVWAALVIVSAIPFGGHHVIDLVGGWVVWCTCFAAWNQDPAMRVKSTLDCANPILNGRGGRT